MAQNIQPVNDANLVAWLVGLASSAVIFFLAWGAKDVKAKFDKVPVLEQEIKILAREVETMKHEIERLQNDLDRRRI